MITFIPSFKKGISVFVANFYVITNVSCIIVMECLPSTNACLSECFVDNIVHVLIYFK